MELFLIALTTGISRKILHIIVTVWNISGSGSKRFRKKRELTFGRVTVVSASVLEISRFRPKRCLCEMCYSREALLPSNSPSLKKKKNRLMPTQ